MPLVIRVMARNVYGTMKFYPVNREARAVAAIAGTKTLTRAALTEAVDGLGATLQVEKSPVADMDLQDPDVRAIVELSNMG